jgi:hypothetical protein
VWGYTSVNDYRERGNDEASVHGEPVSIPAAGRQRQHGERIGGAYQTELERPHAARPELRRRGRLAELDLDAVPPALALRAVSPAPPTSRKRKQAHRGLAPEEEELLRGRHLRVVDGDGPVGGVRDPRLEEDERDRRDAAARGLDRAEAPLVVAVEPAALRQRQPFTAGGGARTSCTACR